MPSSRRLVQYSSSDSEQDMPTPSPGAALSGSRHASIDVHSTPSGHPLYPTLRTAGQPSGYTPMSHLSGIHRDYRRSPEQPGPSRQPTSNLPQIQPPLAPSLRPTAEEEHQLFTMPHLPPSAMSSRDLNYSQVLLFPPPAALRKDGQIMRAWQSANIPSEFRKNNNVLKGSSGTICHIGRHALNLSRSYWAWLTNADAAPHTGGHLARRAVLCDEQHNREAHSRDGEYFECPFEHRLVDFPRWTHTYPYLVCRSCEDAQPDFCAPLVRQMLTEGPLVAMCERCAIDALQRFGPGHNGCRCIRGAFGGMCLVHQNMEAETIARGWLTYRRLHHGPGGMNEHGDQVEIPYCKCNRPPVSRSRRPFAFWCAACEETVVLPDNEDGWVSGNGHAQRWLRLDNLPEADFDAPWGKYPSEAPPRCQGESPVNPDTFCPIVTRQPVVLQPLKKQPPLVHSLPAATADASTQTVSPAAARRPQIVPQISMLASVGPASSGSSGTSSGAIKRHKSQWSSSSIGSKNTSPLEQEQTQTPTQHRKKLPRTTIPTTTTPPGLPRRTTPTTTPPGLPRSGPRSMGEAVDEVEKGGEEKRDKRGKKPAKTDGY